MRSNWLNPTLEAIATVIHQLHQFKLIFCGAMLQGFFHIPLTLLLVVGITPIFGTYLAQVFQFKKTFLDPIAAPVDRAIYRISSLEPEENMTGQEYAIAVLISNSAIAILVFLMLMLQQWLPLNPTKLGIPTWDTALHTSISFLVNADYSYLKFG
jgi:K+-transporting ATPase ATPase A chain